MNITLYHAAELAKLERFVDPDTGEINTEGFEQAVTVLADKQRAVVAYCKNQEAAITMLKAAEADLAAKRKSAENRIASLKAYLMVNMRASGTEEIKAVDGTFSAKLYPDRDESVVLEEGAQFPAELCAKPKPPEPSKTLIKEAILRGEPIDGAHIVRKDRLTIK